MAQMKAGLKAGGRTYDLHWVTGTVVGQGKYVETNVSGGGGGDARVSISSTTTIRNDIFLTDANGKEHSFQLSSFDVACREGHKLTVMWAIKQGQKIGNYIVVINHTTAQKYFDSKALEGMVQSWGCCLSTFLPLPFIFAAIHQSRYFFDRDGMPMFFQIAWTALAWFCVAALIAVFGLLQRAYKAKRFASAFKSTFRFEDYRNDQG